VTANLATLARDLLAPPPAPDCWAWHLQHVATAPPSEGDRRWSPRRARLFRHWHHLVSARLSGRAPAHDPHAARVEEIWVVAGSQIGKDRNWVNAVMAYAIDCYPRAIGYFLPRHRDLAKIFRGRIRPLIERTPRLARHLPQSDAARQDALSVAMLNVGAALIYPLCASVANDLRSHPLRLELWNEFDILPSIVQDEGDPIQLGLDRMKSYPRDRLAVGGTTPTLIDAHGWRHLCLGSHERLLIRCRTCDAHAWINPDQLAPAEPDLPTGVILAQDAAVWRCARCDAAHTSTQIDQAIGDATDRDGWTAAGGWCPGAWEVSQDAPDGQWTAAADSDAGGRIAVVTPPTTAKRSGWLNSLYATEDISLGRFLAHERDAANAGDSEQRTHTNTWRAEPWLPRVEPAPATADIVAGCAGGYPRFTTPPGALKLLISCDQQGQQLELCWFPFVVRAFGAWGRSWLVDAGEVHGWDELEQLQARSWTVAGAARHADAILLDGANGTLRVRIQTWSAADPAHRLVLRGVQFLAVPWLERRNTQGREKRNRRLIAGARVYSYDSTAHKNELDARLRNGNAWLLDGQRQTDTAAAQTALAAHLEKNKRLPIHTPPWSLPDDPPDAYLKSLTSEERIAEIKTIPGEGKRPVLVWKPRTVYDHRGQVTVRTDTHWWDCEVQNLVGADILGWNRLPPAGTTTAPRRHYGAVGSVI
jgi:phage terminase large subunit GpA-like protein